MSKFKKRTWTKEDKEFETRMNQMRIDGYREFINKIDNDPNKEKRLEEQICKCCFYTITAAFQAFTTSTCGFCNEEMTFSNSKTDTLCKRCAVMHEACKECGAEID